MKKALVSSVFLVLLFASCEKVYETERELELKTDKFAYKHGETMVITIDNPTDQAVYYRRCGPVNYRYSLSFINHETGDERVITPDNCRSFNQSRLMVAPRTTEEIEIPLNFVVFRDLDPVGDYVINLTMSGVLPPEPDSTLNSKTNIFQVEL